MGHAALQQCPTNRRPVRRDAAQIHTKLAVLLRRQGMDLSVFMVGRILQHLTETDQLRDAPRRGRPAERLPRPYAVRKPTDYVVQGPGDLVQVDTLDAKVVPGARFKHLSLVDDRGH